MQELLLGHDGKPCFLDYIDISPRLGEVLCKSLYGAPKHGTELTDYLNDPFSSLHYDEDSYIFKRRENVQSNKGILGLGNMWVGEVLEIGSDVTGFTVGQRVAGYGHLRHTHICKAEELLVMPETMTWKQAVCYDPLQFAMGGIRDSHVRLGDTVLVSGLGAIGLMAAQAAKLAGASFVAVSDPISIRREAALENGADLALDPAKEDIGLVLRSHTGDRGVDVVLETSANYIALEQGLRALGYGGTLASIGWFKESSAPLHLGREGHFNQQKIVFSRACSDPNHDHPRWNFERICRESWTMLCKGMFKCENIVQPVVDFSESDQAYYDLIVKHPERSVKMGVSF